MLVTKSTESTNLSPTYLVSNIRHQHRCNLQKSINEKINGNKPRRLLLNYIDFEARIEQNSRFQGPFYHRILNNFRAFKIDIALGRHRVPSYQVGECNHKRIHFEKDLLEQSQFLQELNSDIFELHPNYHLYQELLHTSPYLRQNFLMVF